MLLCSIEKRNSLLQFVFHGTGVELEHLKAPGEKDKAVMIAKVRELADAGKSNREIAGDVGLSHTTVAKYLKT